jgi:hypothetical protein
MALDPNSRAYDPTYVPTKSLEQLVAEHPHVQFFRDMLGMRQDAIAEWETQGEKRWESIGAPLQLSFPGSGTPSRPRTRTQKLLAVAKRILSRMGIRPGADPASGKRTKIP